MLSLQIAAEGVLRRWPNATYVQMDYADYRNDRHGAVAILGADGEVLDDLEAWTALPNSADLHELISNLFNDGDWSTQLTFRAGEPSSTAPPVAAGGAAPLISAARARQRRRHTRPHRQSVRRPRSWAVDRTFQQRPSVSGPQKSSGDDDEGDRVQHRRPGVQPLRLEGSGATNRPLPTAFTCVIDLREVLETAISPMTITATIEGQHRRVGAGQLAAGRALVPSHLNGARGRPLTCAASS